MPLFSEQRRRSLLASLRLHYSLHGVRQLALRLHQRSGSAGERMRRRYSSFFGETVCTCVLTPIPAAAPHCPVGGVPKGHCVRRAQYQETVENMGNSGGNADDCRDGYYCVTPSDSPIGHCCPPVCPLGSTPDPSYSCDPNTSSSNRCPSDTHHCHRVAG